MLGTSIVLGIFATILVFMWEKEPPRPPLALSPERIVKIEAPQAVEFQKQQKREAEKAEAKDKEKEGQMKKAKEKAGKLGRDDSKVKDTIIPKGREDILREKVQKIGILSIIGKDKAPGSGLSKLFAQNNDVEQAVAGMAGAKMQVGRGVGRPVDQRRRPGRRRHRLRPHLRRGQPGHGRPRPHGKGRGPKLAERGEHEVGVSMGSGAGDTDGSLSKEQINKVVRAHLAGIKYCYEKELQHKASLSGGIDVFWIIQPDGTVSKANVKNTTMGDAAVEGCIIRQVKQWQFPKAPASDDGRALSLHFQRWIGMGQHDEAQSSSTDAAGAGGNDGARLFGDEHAALLRRATTIESTGGRRAVADQRPDAAVPRPTEHGADAARQRSATPSATTWTSPGSRATRCTSRSRTR